MCVCVCVCMVDMILCNKLNNHLIIVTDSLRFNHYPCMYTAKPFLLQLFPPVNVTATEMNKNDNIQKKRSTENFDGQIDKDSYGKDFCRSVE